MICTGGMNIWRENRENRFYDYKDLNSLIIPGCVVFLTSVITMEMLHREPQIIANPPYQTVEQVSETKIPVQYFATEEESSSVFNPIEGKVDTFFILHPGQNRGNITFTESNSRYNILTDQGVLTLSSEEGRKVLDFLEDVIAKDYKESGVNVGTLYFESIRQINGELKIKVRYHQHNATA
jgi:hypothetical protein